jgi:hypothetical protein
MNALANQKRKDYARVDVIGYRKIKEVVPPGYTLEFEKIAERV